MAAGTLAYAPPEQFAGGTASPAADVYAATATFYECLTGQPPFTGRTAEMLMRQHMTEPVPLEPVPEALRPLVEAGMAKDPARRPADGAALVAGLRTAAGQAYGPGWEERGRSRLAEAALLLAALWPSGGPAAVQASTVHQVSLRRHLPHRHISMVKAAIMAGIVIAGAAAGTAVAATVSRPSSSPAAATPAPSATATSGAHDYNNLAQLDQAISEWVVQSKHTGLLQEANCQESAANQYTCDVLYSIPAGAEYVAVVAVTPNGGSFTVVSYNSFASAPSPTTAAPSPAAPGGHDYNNLSQLDAAVAASISASSGLAVTNASCVVWPTLAYNYTCTIYYQKAGTEVFHVVVTPNGSSFSIVSGG